MPEKVKGLARTGAQAAPAVLAGAALLASGGIALAARRLRDRR
ncbi:LPXTG cell wall anchor domain-containing protein [Actinomyces faecalis]|nr:LPXTG cell wall anchor domain-containing protein [Actinomyces faecalis]